MIDKYLRRFCAQEIQIMIAKMEEDYGEFTSYQSAWGRLAEVTRHLTGVEKYCLRKAKRRAARNHDRQQYLGAILKQQLNPMTREELEDGMGATSKAQYIQMMQMARQQAMNQAANSLANQTNQSLTGLYQQGYQQGARK
jgi:hypothetical protein